MKASISTELRSYEDLEGEAGLLVIDGKVFAAATPEQAFGQWLALTEWLAAEMTPSRAWQALHTAVAHGRVAVTADARHDELPDYTSAATVLGIVKETLGADAWAKVRQAVADQMLGKRPASG